MNYYLVIINIKSIETVVIKQVVIMKLSTRVRYGLRFMIELATHYGKGSLNLKDVAKSQDISDKYLSQIVIDLKSSHLIDGFRGAHGGYVLARPPQEVSVYDLVVALEGELSLVDCVRNPAACNRVTSCVGNEVWAKLGQTMTDTLESMTLADLVKRRQEKQPKDTMYYI